MVTKIGCFIFLTVFIIVVGAVGGQYQFTTTHGVSSNMVGSGSTPSNVSDVVQWVIGAAGFMFLLSTFSAAGVPAIFSGVFIVVDLIWLILLVLIIRGD